MKFSDPQSLEERLETERQQKLYESMIFLFKIVAFGLLFRLILFIYPNTYPIQAIFAELIALILQPLMSIQVNEIYLLTAENAYVIVQDCLGWKSMAVFTALFFSSTNQFREQAKYLFYGLTSIFVANIVRVASTIYLSEIGIISFEVIHSFLWRWGLTFIVLLIWIYWYKNILDSESKDLDENVNTE